MKYFQFSDGNFSCRLKVLVSTKFNLQQKAINQTNRVRAYCTHPTRRFSIPHDSQVGCVAQPRTRSIGYTGYGLLLFNIKC